MPELNSCYIMTEFMFLLLAVDGDSAGPSTAHTVLGQTETLAGRYL